MKTFCNTDATCPADIKQKLDAIEAAFREYVCTHKNPSGGCAYYDEGEKYPWRVLYEDGISCESFETSQEAVDAVTEYADRIDASANAD